MKEREEKSENFWDLGKARERKYEKPDFSGHTIDTTEICEDTDGENKAFATQPEKIRTDLHTSLSGEKIDRSYAFLDPIGGRRVVTTSYRRHTHPTKTNAVAATRRASGEVVLSYEKNGVLLKKVDVRTWESDTEFYGRFTTDALLSHRTASVIPPDASLPEVPYFSYVPQYAHMNQKQVEYYRYVRENIRLGRTVACDLPYLLLYLYEIINLPNEIAPETGAHLIANVWLGYRKMYPRLDSYLCEWLPDYCLIHGIPMPEELRQILAEITPKAQFKEFFLDAVLTENGNDLGAILCEVSSDYDYKNSRYYKEHRELYDTHIPAALSIATRRAIQSGYGAFSLDRTYKMTRDSYCGAIVSSAEKRRVDVEFCSFTRRADVRLVATAMVKHAENKIRILAGIKAKLSVDKPDERVNTLIDEYFAPILPLRAKPDEDRYMPEDYLKNYEAEPTGFSLAHAEEIEMRSWANTERLTGEEYLTPLPETEEAPLVDGELSCDSIAEACAEQTQTNESDVSVAMTPEGGLERIARAVLDGQFSAYCRENGLFEGEAADRLNTAMLDVIGDIVLENDGAYYLIEDYREELEQWLRQ